MERVKKNYFKIFFYCTKSVSHSFSFCVVVFADIEISIDINFRFLFVYIKIQTGVCQSCWCYLKFEIFSFCLSSFGNRRVLGDISDAKKDLKYLPIRCMVRLIDFSIFPQNIGNVNL
jgi:hypothetical protein